ncbi:MAG: hypothetical protein AB7G47_07300 [Mycolicibacterium sp.]|uniref:hypothetical protein n=1 Tax=Mycolicibacterium sp. TaxID=2320850 RepID=UPI003D0C0EAA
MNSVIATDFLASAARQQSLPLWVIIAVGLIAAGITDRVPQVRNAKMWKRYLFAAFVGGVVGAIVWCVGYFFFNVDLS